MLRKCVIGGVLYYDTIVNDYVSVSRRPNLVVEDAQLSRTLCDQGSSIRDGMI
jgi:hypothetical protein